MTEACYKALCMFEEELASIGLKKSMDLKSNVEVATALALVCLAEQFCEVYDHDSEKKGSQVYQDGLRDGRQQVADAIKPLMKSGTIRLVDDGAVAFEVEDCPSPSEAPQTPSGVALDIARAAEPQSIRYPSGAGGPKDRSGSPSSVEEESK